MAHNPCTTGRLLADADAMESATYQQFIDEGGDVLFLKRKPGRSVDYSAPLGHEFAQGIYPNTRNYLFCRRCGEIRKIE